MPWCDGDEKPCEPICCTAAIATPAARSFANTIADGVSPVTVRTDPSPRVIVTL
jgi:hypothetical protein